VARLTAIQALYVVDMTGTPLDGILDDFIGNGLGGIALLSGAGDAETESPIRLAEPDELLFVDIVRGTWAQCEAIDAMIGGALTGDWTVERLETVLRAILRAGAFELSSRPDIPMKVVISEYVDVTYAFYAGPEPGLVNAVLDRIGRVVRAQETNPTPG